MRFPETDIISLVELNGDAPRHDLGASVGPDLELTALLHAPVGADLLTSVSQRWDGGTCEPDSPQTTQ